MKSLSDKKQSDLHEKMEADIFKQAVSWKLPEISGNIINQHETATKQTAIDEVKEFENNIRKRLREIQEEKDHPRYLTVEQIEQIQKQAYDDAYEAAFKKGLEESEKRVQESIQEEKNLQKQKADQLQQAFNSLASPMKMLDQQLEQQLTEMVFYFCRALVTQDLSVNPIQVSHLISQTVALLPITSTKVKIRLNTGDFDLLKQHGISFEDQEWQVESSDSLKPGSCQVDSTAGRINYSIEEKISELAQQLYIDLLAPATAANHLEDDASQDIDDAAG